MENKKTLTAEERIARIEMAPKEVQTMVAKAFLRDDIDDEDISITLTITDGGAVE